MSFEKICFVVISLVTICFVWVPIRYVLYGLRYYMFCMGSNTICFVWAPIRYVLYWLRYEMFCMGSDTICFVWAPIFQRYVLYGLRYFKDMFCMGSHISKICFVWAPIFQRWGFCKKLKESETGFDLQMYPSQL